LAKMFELLTDYEGNIWKNPPSIGAYEFNSQPPNPIIPKYLNSFIENNSAFIIQIVFDVSRDEFM
jgi:hypothetical protein